MDPVTWAAAGAVAKWVGEKAAGGLVSAAMGKVFSEVMDAIGMGGTDLVGKLDKISDQLVQVQKSLDVLTAMTAEILKQLTELKDFIEKSLQVDKLGDAMRRINVAYGEPAAGGLPRSDSTGGAVTLRELVEEMPHYKDVTQEYLRNKANDFAAHVSGIPYEIATIYEVLAVAPLEQVTLLTHWTKEFARQVNAKKLGREAAYLALESYFLRAVSVQLKGVSVHCVALGTDREHGAERIRLYLGDKFAKMMAGETAAFVEAVELLLCLTLAPTMPTGMQDGLGEREFPKHVDEILLRADLLSAALNLVGHKEDSTGKPSPSIQAAIQGIYGRALFRPSDLKDGKPPAFAPAGYRASAGTAVRELPFPCLDLMTGSDGRAVLRDATSSVATMARYYWEFPSPAPAEGKPIDPGQRGGVTPARYPVFGTDQPPVLAASVFDVSRLYRGLPTGAQKTYDFSKFPGNNPDLGYYNESCKPYHHALTNDQGDAFETHFTVVHIWRLDTRQHSYVVHPLFKYSGGAAKVRLTAHVASIIHRDPRKDGTTADKFSEWDVYSHLKLRRLQGWEKEFYNSVKSTDWKISVEGPEARAAWYQNYDARKDGFYSVDFDLEAGDYELVLDSEVYFIPAPREYQGWQSTSLSFFLHGLSLERL